MKRAKEYVLYLKKRQKQIKMQKRERELKEELDDIEYCLDVILDVNTIENCGLDTLKQAYYKAVALAMANPISDYDDDENDSFSQEPSAPNPNTSQESSSGSTRTDFNQTPPPAAYPQQNLSMPHSPFGGAPQSQSFHGQQNRQQTFDGGANSHSQFGNEHSFSFSAGGYPSGDPFRDTQNQSGFPASAPRFPTGQNTGPIPMPWNGQSANNFPMPQSRPHANPYLNQNSYQQQRYFDSPNFSPIGIRMPGNMSSPQAPNHAHGAPYPQHYSGPRPRPMNFSTERIPPAANSNEIRRDSVPPPPNSAQTPMSRPGPSTSGHHGSPPPLPYPSDDTRSDVLPDGTTKKDFARIANKCFQIRKGQKNVLHNRGGYPPKIRPRQELRGDSARPVRPLFRPGLDVRGSSIRQVRPQRPGMDGPLNLPRFRLNQTLPRPGEATPSLASNQILASPRPGPGSAKNAPSTSTESTKINRPAGVKETLDEKLARVKSAVASLPQPKTSKLIDFRRQATNANPGMVRSRRNSAKTPNIDIEEDEVPTEADVGVPEPQPTNGENNYLSTSSSNDEESSLDTDAEARSPVTKKRTSTNVKRTPRKDTPKSQSSKSQRGSREKETVGSGSAKKRRNSDIDRRNEKAGKAQKPNSSSSSVPRVVEGSDDEDEPGKSKNRKKRRIVSESESDYEPMQSTKKQSTGDGHKKGSRSSGAPTHSTSKKSSSGQTPTSSQSAGSSRAQVTKHNKGPTEEEVSSSSIPLDTQLPPQPVDQESEYETNIIIRKKKKKKHKRDRETPIPPPAIPPNPRGHIIGARDLVVNSGLCKVKIEADYVPPVSIKPEPIDMESANLNEPEVLSDDLEKEMEEMFNPSSSDRDEPERNNIIVEELNITTSDNEEEEEKLKILDLEQPAGDDEEEEVCPIKIRPIQDLFEDEHEENVGIIDNNSAGQENKGPNDENENESHLAQRTESVEAPDAAADEPVISIGSVRSLHEEILSSDDMNDDPYEEISSVEEMELKSNIIIESSSTLQAETVECNVEDQLENVQVQGNVEDELQTQAESSPMDSPSPVPDRCTECEYEGPELVTHYVHEHEDMAHLIPDAFLNTKSRNVLFELNSCKNKSGLLKIRLRENMWPCFFCTTITDDISQFYDHVSTHTGEFRISCNLCSRRFPYVHNFQAHMSESHKDEMEKQEDRKLFKILKTPKSFNQAQHEVKGFMCDSCSYFQLTQGSMERHLKKTGHPRQSLYVIQFSMKSHGTEKDSVLYPISMSGYLEEPRIELKLQAQSLTPKDKISAWLSNNSVQSQTGDIWIPTMQPDRPDVEPDDSVPTDQGEIPISAFTNQSFQEYEQFCVTLKSKWDRDRKLKEDFDRLRREEAAAGSETESDEEDSTSCEDEEEVHTDDD